MLEKILTNYFTASPTQITPLTMGLINETYKVDYDEQSYILQKLNPIFAPKVMYDIEAVTNHLASKNFLAPQVMRTCDGLLWHAENNEVWRVLSYIHGEAFETIKNTKHAYEAGRILGKFHQALQDFTYAFQHHRPLHHATEKHFELLLPHLNHSAQRKAENEATPVIKEIVSTILELPKLILPKTLRKNSTHGDPKISNVIFRDHKAASLIDFDDCGNEHNVLVELGDAMRSWCGGEEDDPHNSFDLQKFEVVLRGYFDGSNKFLLPEELALLPQAIQLITLELASRFFRDYFEDSYFGWNKQKYKSRKAHNLTRTNGQVALYKDIVKKEKKINEIIKQFS